MERKRRTSRQKPSARKARLFSDDERIFDLFAALPLLAADVTRVTKTETIPFTGSGTLRFEASNGEMHVIAWDRPEIEITLSKSTYNSKDRRFLDDIHIQADRHDRDVVVQTIAPKHKDVQLYYEVHAPANISLAIDHGKGGVYVTGIAGDIQAHVRDGQITLRVPADATYAINAKSRIGTVYSDFEGAQEKRTIGFSETFTKPADSAKKLDLQIGFGDIVISQTPLPLTAARKLARRPQPQTSPKPNPFS